MATRTNVDIELRTKDKTSPSVKKAKGSLESLGDTTKNKVGPALLGTFAKVAIGAAAAGAAIAVAFDAVLYAAQVQQTRMSFESIAADSGVQADAVIANMRRMSGETINELDMMLAANRANLLGLPVDKFSDLMAIARASATATGGAVKDMFSDIVVGIGRASPMILDNLGITVKIGKANEDYARSIGKTVKQLTDQEKKQGLLNAVLVQGEEIIRKVGEAGQTVTAAEYFQQATAAADDLKATVGELLLPTFIALATEVTKSLRGINALIKQSNKLREAKMALAEGIATVSQKLFIESDSIGKLQSHYRTLEGQYKAAMAIYGETSIQAQNLAKQVDRIGGKIAQRLQELDIAQLRSIVRETGETIEDLAEIEEIAAEKAKKSSGKKIAFADAYLKIQKQLVGYMDPQLKALWDQKLALEAQKSVLDKLAETVDDPARLQGLQEWSSLNLTIEGELGDISKQIADFSGLGFAGAVDEIVAGLGDMSFEMMGLNDMTSLWLDNLGGAQLPMETLISGLDNLSTGYQDTLGVMEDFDKFMKNTVKSTSSLEKAFARLILTSADWADFFVNTLQAAIMSTLQGIGQAIGDSEDTWKALGDVALGVIADILDALGKQLVLWSLSCLVQFNFIRAAAAAAAAVAAVAAVAAFAGAAYVRSLQTGGSRNPAIPPSTTPPEAEPEAPTTTIYGGTTSITRIPDIYIYQTFNGHIIGPSGMEEFGELTADALETYAGIGGRIHIEEAIAPVSGGG